MEWMGFFMYFLQFFPRPSSWIDDRGMKRPKTKRAKSLGKSPQGSRIEVALP